MSESKAGTRPSQVTMAGWVAAVASVMLVLTIFDSISNVRSVEVREGVEEFLSTPPGSGLGLEVPEVVEIIRVLMLVSGAAGAAAMILAIYVLRRNNAARIGYTAAAIAIMVTAPVSGGFLPVLIAFAAMLLWTRPARDWFAGTSTSASSPQKGHAVSSENHPPAGENPHPDSSGQQGWPRPPESSPDRPAPPPTYGFGNSGQSSGEESGEQSGGGSGPGPWQGQERPGQQGPQDRPDPWQGQPGGARPGSWPPPAYPGGSGQSGSGGQQGQGYTYPPQHGQQYPPQHGQPYDPQYGQQYPYPPQQYGQYGGYPGYGAPRDPDKRPGTVSVAAWITWILSGFVVLAFLFVAFGVLVSQEEMLRQLRQQPEFEEMPLSNAEIIAAVWASVAIVLLWGLSAIVLAWFAYRRANWARITLIVSTGVMILFGLLALPVSILHILAGVAVIVLLFTGGANQWYSRQGGGGYPSYAYPSGQYGGQGQYGQPGAYGQGQYGGPGQYGQPGAYGQPGHPGAYGQPGQPGQQGDGGSYGPHEGDQQGRPGPYGGGPDQSGEGQEGRAGPGDRPSPYGPSGQPGPYGDQGRPPRGDEEEPPRNVW